jgi:hypothetical protein
MPPPQHEGGAGNAAAGGDGASGAGGGAGGSAGTWDGAAGSGAGGDAAGAAGDAGPAADGATYVQSCPAALPAAGGSCAPENRICSYGAAPRGDCRDVATCAAGGKWSVRKATCAAPSPAAECPATAPAAGAACPKPEQVCAYPATKECMCLAGAAGWACDSQRPSNPGCPPAPPNAGTACAGTSSCSYPCGLLGTSAVTASCVGGAWTWGLLPCGAN